MIRVKRKSTKKFLDFAYSRFPWCQWCGMRVYRSVNGQDRHRLATTEHIIPLCKGGSNEWKNLGISCRGCNSYRRAGTDRPICGPKDWHKERQSA